MRSEGFNVEVIFYVDGESIHTDVLDWRLRVMRDEDSARHVSRGLDPHVPEIRD